MAPAITAASDSSHSLKLDDGQTHEAAAPGAPAEAHAPQPKMRPPHDSEPEPLISEDDLLQQVLKTMEENKGEVLGQLLNLELLEGVGGGSGEAEGRLAEVAARQHHLQRRLDRLRRLLRKKQARNLGFHASLQIYEMVTTTKALLKARGLRLHAAAASDDLLDPDHVNGMSPRALASLVKQLSSGGGGGGGLTATLGGALSHEQAAALAGGSGQLGQRLQHVEAAFDSDVTASSSGGDSADEAASFPSHNQAKAPIQKRAAWRFARERASAASRWAWLTANIAELEYRIRQLGDYQRQVRGNKGAVALLPRVGPSEEPPAASRVAPLDLATFRKRKLFVPGMLTPKAAKRVCPSATQPPCCRDSCSMPCVLCFPKKGAAVAGVTEVGGRESVRERAARLDPAVHPVLSANADVGRSLHMAALLRQPGWQQAQLRTRGGLSAAAVKKATQAAASAAALTVPAGPKRKYSKNSSHASAISAKLRKKAKARKKLKQQRMAAAAADNKKRVKKVSCSAAGAEEAPGGGGGLLHELRQVRRKRESSYDIDNIVIPYSMAALTRVEKLEYKEILTPKWRVAQILSAVCKGKARPSTDESEVEDISDEAVGSRHEPLELEERRKFRCVPQRGAVRGRRTDSRAESSGANTPDPMSPSGVPEGVDSPLTSPRATPLPLEELGRSKGRRRTASLLLLPEAPPLPFLEEVARPFEPRVFPLSEEQCQKILSEEADEVVTLPPPSTAPAPQLVAEEAVPEAAGAAVGPASPCSSDSTESALPEDDPEWTLPDDDDRSQ
ncbi:KAT8 regulatory NSL complex subunit 1 [Neocloeon triangulifer]|uniref:KAT8 regulatory NSL complex subunit 1 n=1 Tax=Neocloeon triangulifer TaxID=2078957 RepID=UPI00286F7BBB|nr:KAT8 regulatory NSL complex subunit 1 [Neocloeon triangulifer]